jgi:ABC-type Zn uptake system ZnuABC Zn-binding protein ZnuA
MLLAFTLGGWNLSAAAAKKDKPIIAVSTSILMAGISDLYGERVEVYVMIPPGGCPGQYDMTPPDLAKLSAADLIVLHDYQEPMQKKLESSLPEARPMLIIAEEGSLITPPGYKRLLETLAREVPQKIPGLRPITRTALEQALASVQKAEDQARTEGAEVLQGKSVVAAHFQAEFCRFWGMEIAAEIDSAESLSAKELDQILKAAKAKRALAVVGNAQNGQNQFEAMAQRLGLPLVMLSNFPEEKDGRASYQTLLISNVRALRDGIASH